MKVNTYFHNSTLMSEIINNECVTCLENKLIYLLPCLHQICSDCLNDNLNDNLQLNYSKNKCVSCYEQFDLNIVKTMHYSNYLIKDQDQNQNDQLLISTTKTIDEIKSVLKSFIEHKKEIIEYYLIIIDNIKNLQSCYDHLKDDLLNQRDSLQKSDLKIIDLEIETIQCLLDRYERFYFVIKSYNLSQIDLDYIKLQNTDFIKKSLVNKRIFDSKSHKIINYEIENNGKWLEMFVEQYSYHENVKNYVSNFIINNKLKLFYDEFNQDIKGCIPYGVTHITFSRNFNQIVKDCIPNSVTHLSFGNRFNQEIKDSIPNSVKYLKFGTGYHNSWVESDFNRNIRGCIPYGVTHLIFGTWFNQNIKECIPNSVTHLCFGYKFNQNIKNCIPNSVTYLIFGESFNQILEPGCIPYGVTHLEFGRGFNQPLIGCIPNSVTHIILERDYQHSLIDCIPSSVIWMNLCYNSYINVHDIPISVKIVNINCYQFDLNLI
jgi:hypothetical protein